MPLSGESGQRAASPDRTRHVASGLGPQNRAPAPACARMASNALVYWPV